MKCVKCLQALAIPDPSAQSAIPEPAVPVDPPVAAVTEHCPFCMESIRKGHHRCKVCGLLFRAGASSKARAQFPTRNVLISVSILLVLAAIAFTCVLWKNKNASTELTTNRAQPASPQKRTGSDLALVELQSIEEKKSSEARAQFTEAARATMAAIEDIEIAIKSKTELEVYSQRVVTLSTSMDKLLEVAEQTGMYKSNADAREFCKVAASIFLAHSQAINQWNLENVHHGEKDAARVAHKQLIQDGADAAKVSQSAKELGERLDQLTKEVMAAIEARYNLWKEAETQVSAAESLLSRLK